MSVILIVGSVIEFVCYIIEFCNMSVLLVYIRFKLVFPLSIDNIFDEVVSGFERDKF